MATRTGKIARLPHALREQVNLRLLDGQSSTVILAWLNAEPDAIATWDRDFEGVPASPQNLSEWKLGGWKDWRTLRDRADGLESLSSVAVNIAKAGGRISDGLAAMIGGHIMEAFETIIHADEGDETPDDPVGRIDKLSSAVKKIRDGDVAVARLDLDKDKADQSRERLNLDRKKFETQTVTKFLEFAKKPEAIAILNSGKTNSLKMAELRALMFGKVKEVEA